MYFQPDEMMKYCFWDIIYKQTASHWLLTFYDRKVNSSNTSCCYSTQSSAGTTNTQYTNICGVNHNKGVNVRSEYFATEKTMNFNWNRRPKTTGDPDSGWIHWVVNWVYVNQLLGIDWFRNWFIDYDWKEVYNPKITLRISQRTLSTCNLPGAFL